jgi:serine/threonine protein kinase
MPRRDASKGHLDAELLLRWENVLHDFEKAWKSPKPPRIEDFYRDSGAKEPALLMELVHIDLEYQLRSGANVNVEDYLHRFPELETNGAQFVELIVAEYRLCRSLGRTPQVEDYLRRFPHFQTELAKQLGIAAKSIDLPLPGEYRILRDSPYDDAAKQPSVQSDFPVPLTHIGPYKLLQKLGEGGMGAVYMAEQEHPIKRRVALKVIREGLDSAHVLARFEAERQSLAIMDHPNIARVLEVGATAEGRPYFVMDLVKGISITKYCDQERLTPQERLALFVPVCQAVQHAHQKGIIHRDLKPSNVLVALYDGTPVPKVIDFGLAKATGPKLTERTMFTEVGQIVGTLEYMSPEQAELNQLDIDTRSDIYSLGVLLYELLTGSPPFTGKELQSVGFAEMLRMIREVEPPKPSTKLSSSDALPAIAAKRKLEPKRLAKSVQGELDWIVMKCLEKERGRRYQTATGLAEDVQRFLQNEPVTAGPASVCYRLSKFARRNKGVLLTALAAAFVSLIIGALTFRNMQHLDEDARSVSDSHEVMDLTSNILQTLIDAETGQRGFLVSGQDKYLVSYFDALSRWEQRMAALKNKANENTLQQDRIKQLELMIADELALLKQGIELRRLKGMGSQLLGATDAAKQQMDAIRGVVWDIRDKEQDLLRNRQEQTASTYRFALGSAVLSTTIGFFVVMAFAWAVQRSIHIRS